MSVRRLGMILKELWTKEVNIPEFKTSYEYLTELREHLEDSLRWPKKNKSPRNDTRGNTIRKAKLRRLEVGDQVLILLPTESNKLINC